MAEYTTAGRQGGTAAWRHSLPSRRRTDPLPFIIRHASTADSRLSGRPFHRCHLRHGRGRPARLPLRSPRVVQPGPGNARDRPASRRAAQGRCGAHHPRRPGVRPGPRHSGVASGGRRAVQLAVPPGEAVAIQPSATSASAAGAAARSPEPSRRWARSTWATSCRTTPRTKSCSTSSSSSPPFPSCSTAARVRVLCRRPAPGDHRARSLRHSALQSEQSHGQGDPRNGSGRLGSHRAGTAVLAPAGRILLSLRLGPGIAAAFPPPSSWRMWTRIRSFSSTV